MLEIIRALLDNVRNKRSRRSGNGDHLTPEPLPNLGLGSGDDHMNGDVIHEDDREETDEELWMKDPGLPLLFVRASEGIGFHSGYALRCLPAAAPNTPHIDGWSIWVSRVENLDHASGI